MGSAIRFVLLLLLVPETTSVSLVEWTWIHDPSLDDLYLEYATISSGIQDSLLDCAWTCFLRLDCASFYTWSSGASVGCELKSHVFSSMEVSTFSVIVEGYTYYVISPKCPEGATFYTISRRSGLCIHLALNSDTNFLGAVDACDTLGGELINLDRPVASVEVARILVGNSGVMERTYWVGASRENSQSPYVWLNGQEVDDDFLDAGDGRGEDCLVAAINSQRSGMDGYSQDCLSRHSYICSLDL